MEVSQLFVAHRTFLSSCKMVHICCFDKNSRIIYLDYRCFGGEQQNKKQHANAILT